MLNNQQIAQVKYIIIHMSEQEFLQFQTELQYAVKWWSTAYTAADKHILWNDANQQYPKARDFLFHGMERSRTIITSPLYDAVRERIRLQLPGETVPDNWAGWTGLASKQDVDAINKALEAMLHRELPTGFIPLTGIETTNEQFTEAQATLARYNIKGVFVEDPTVEHLVATFLQHYGQKN